MNNSFRIKIFQDVMGISRYTFSQLIAIGGAGKVALSFGSTFKEIFSNWSKIVSEYQHSEGLKHLPSFYPVDERITAFENIESNWGTACRKFLSQYGNDNDLRRHPANFNVFKKMIETDLGSGGQFDITFLGLGQDGHSASLFTNKCPDRFTDSWFLTVLKTQSSEHLFERLTLGPEVLARSKKLYLVVTGSEKISVLSSFLHQLNNGYKNTEEILIFPAVKIFLRRIELGLKSYILCDETLKRTLSVFKGIPLDYEID